MIPLQLWAGVLRGMIHDGETGDVLIGANVFIEGTTRGASTNIGGRFTIGDLDAGKYTVRIFTYSKVLWPIDQP